MPFKSEPGIIRKVERGLRPLYQVELSSGGIVYVKNEQVTPPRITLLPVGEKLLVTYDEQRKVTSAIWKDSLGGRVIKIEGYGPGLVYRVELENGKVIPVSREVIELHPDHTLGIDTELDITLSEERVRKARLLRERREVKVQTISLEKGVITVKGQQGEPYTIRMSLADLRQALLDERLMMEIQYGEKGDRKIVLERPKQKKASPSPGGKASWAKPVAEERFKPDFGPPDQAPLEATLSGVDQVYLTERLRENHRPEIMSFLEEHSRDGLLEWYQMREAVTARFSEPRKPLAPLISSALQKAEPEFKGFYLHQALALDAIRDGKHIVIVTQTASGKTLSYNPAIFERICDEPGAHALYLFPLNALMADQKEKIDALSRSLAEHGKQVNVERLQGGLSKDQRQAMAQNSPHLLATNPEMLSVILNESEQWASFFNTLRYVVIDEVHSYRGIFGVHMSGLLRRLLITANRFGSTPQLILCSATVSNPIDLAVRLTSLPSDSFCLISEKEDGSRQDYKHWAVLNPEWGSAGTRYDHYLDVAASVFVELISGRRTKTRSNQSKTGTLNTILFARSIREVNRLYRLIAENLRHRDPHLLQRIKSYVSAELTQVEKHEIYGGLRSGKMVGVISTNALEAGIDIGRLDACIIAGFPFSVMRLRQMAGRVGRQNEGMVLFIPYPVSGLDGYYRDHPDLLLSQPPEVFVVDPENPYVARKHINAAAYPGPGLDLAELKSFWGENGERIAQQAVKDGIMRFSGYRFYGSRRAYSDLDDEYAVHSLRSNNKRPYTICLEHDQACTLKAECFNQQRRSCSYQINVLDQMNVYRDCHPGAVYESSGCLYKVTGFDDVKRVVRVKELPDNYVERTSVEEDLMVEILGEPRSHKNLCYGVDLYWGHVLVTHLYTGFRIQSLIPARSCRRCRKEFNEETLTCPICARPTDVSFGYSKSERLDFPTEYQQGFTIKLKTVACWLVVDPEVEDKIIDTSPCKLPGENNHVLTWLKTPMTSVDRKWQKHEQQVLSEYHHQASARLKGMHLGGQETILFPGVYGQCLLSALRARLGESRSLEIFEQTSNYPVTNELRHVCRKCQTSTLMDALHTLEHAILLRYPSVALGDQTDLGSYSTLGHSGVGRPAVFWFDDYEGGLGAAEKIYERFDEIIDAAALAVQQCSCSTLEGCPRCTHLGGCVNGNDSLNKLAFLRLVEILTNKTYSYGFDPFIYRKKRSTDFSQAYRQNEYVQAAHGLGEEAPGTEQGSTFNPFEILRLQREVHDSVARKAFEVRSKEIAQELPPVSAIELSQAFRQVLDSVLQQDWQIRQNRSPYQILEILPTASLKMIQQVYRVIALQVHPDSHPDRTAWATEMMKMVNAAYEAILAEKKHG